MNRLSVIPDSPAHWHSMRARVLTSTDIATLFGYNRYQTLTELWWLKRARQVQNRPDTEAMKRGRDREPIVAQAVARIKNWVIRPKPEFITIPELRMGSSFDYECCFGWGACPNEIKTSSAWVIPMGYWHVNGQELTYAGPRVELQLQTEMLVSNSPCCYVSAETDDGRKYWGYRQVDPLVQRMIVDRAADFWKAFDKDIPLPGVSNRKPKQLRQVA